MRSASFRPKLNQLFFKMKKHLILLSLLASACGFCATAQAAITWTWSPVNGSTDWLDSSNWLQDGIPSQVIPQISPNRGNVTIAGNYTVISPAGTKLEFYGGTFTITDGAQVNMQDFYKFQKVDLVIGEGSSLTTRKADNTFIYANCSDPMMWQIDGTLNIESSLNFNNNFSTLQVHLGSTGILNLTNQTTLGTFSFSADLGDLITEGAAHYQLVTRELVTGLGSSVTTSNTTITGGTQEVDNVNDLALNAENAGKYQVFTQDGKVYVSYISGAVPEPATATMGLLGMAALLLRRNRR